MTKQLAQSFSTVSNSLILEVQNQYLYGKHKSKPWVVDLDTYSSNTSGSLFLSLTGSCHQWRSQKVGLGVQFHIFALKSSFKIKILQTKFKNQILSSAQQSLLGGANAPMHPLWIRYCVPLCQCANCFSYFFLRQCVSGIQTSCI